VTSITFNELLSLFSLPQRIMEATPLSCCKRKFKEKPDLDCNRKDGCYRCMLCEKRSELKASNALVLQGPPVPNYPDFSERAQKLRTEQVLLHEDVGKAILQVAGDQVTPEKLVLEKFQAAQLQYQTAKREYITTARAFIGEQRRKFNADLPGLLDEFKKEACCSICSNKRVKKE
jgi:hypothetical protein